MQPLENLLDSGEKLGKAVCVRQAEWASPVDFKKTLNPYLRVDHHALPRPDGVFANISDGKVFFSLDLTDAYMQLPLHTDSQELCIVNTHKGLHKPTSYFRRS